MSHFLFTSESVCQGHPDKIADQISDAVLDACLQQDPEARVACEAMVFSGMVVLAGELRTSAHIDYQQIVRQTVRDIGYTHADYGMDERICGVLVSIQKQSPDIAQGVDQTGSKELGAGDQGLMFGYASDETPTLMPLAIDLSHRIVQKLAQLRKEKKISYLRPDGKAQITVEYDCNHKPVRIHTVVVSVQHDEKVSQERIQEDMRAVVGQLAPKEMIDKNTLFFINPTGRFVLGGPQADCGLTGRKIIVDSYGGMAHHGGGCFSGKDGTKVDRSASYMGRYIAKNIVAAGFAKRCEIQLAYAIGVSDPISVHLETYGTHTVSVELLARIVPLAFDLSPRGMIQTLGLQRPIFTKTAFGGHFGREDADFFWERTDCVERLQRLIKQESFSLS